MTPEFEWTGSAATKDQITEWMRQRGNSPRLYPASLVWCLKKPGRDLRDKIELWLAWKRIAKEIADGTLAGDFEKVDRAEIQGKVAEAEEAAKDEVWGGYRFAVISDKNDQTGLKTIDLGAGHSSSGETLCGRIIAALKSQALLNESVGASYVDRNWPPALKASGAWPLGSPRQSSLDRSLTRLLDPDTVLKIRMVEWVSKAEFGLASAQKPDGTFERVWFSDLVAPDEITFASDVFLLTKSRAKTLKAEPEPGPTTKTKTIRLSGSIPPELWNRLGTKIIPKLKSGKDVSIEVTFATTVDLNVSKSLESELRQLLQDLGIGDRIRIE
jgi:hypothetical protein